jgi:hypothetical protein
MAEAISCGSVTAEVQVQSQTSSCGGKSDISLPLFGFPLSISRKTGGITEETPKHLEVS